MGNNSRKQTVWVYAVILFTSAFVVLLLTAYSQIKFNKNMDQYKNQLSEEEKAKVNFQTNLNTALNENKKISQDVKSVKEELEKVKNELAENQKKLADASEKFDQYASSYDGLLFAVEEFDKGDRVKCAVILHNQCNAADLKGKALEKYNELVEKTYVKAAEFYYREGYKEYLSNNNISAIDSFKLSLAFSQDQYFSDDCYYFLGYAYYNEQNSEMAKSVLETLLQKYSDSNYKKDSELLLKKLASSQ